MSRFCRICGRERPNERFGGKGLRAVICSTCRQRPKHEKTRILATEEVNGFLDQTNISAKNIRRLEELKSIEDEAFQLLRGLVLEIALKQPHKRRRWKLLRQNHTDLYDRLVDFGLVDHPPDDFEFRL